jgi:hypothetical protein
MLSGLIVLPIVFACRLYLPLKMMNTPPVLTDAMHQMPLDYCPRAVRVVFDGVEAFRVLDGETVSNPAYRRISSVPTFIEMWWDDKLVYVYTAEGVLLNLLSDLSSHAVQSHFDLENF